MAKMPDEIVVPVSIDTEDNIAEHAKAIAVLHRAQIIARFKRIVRTREFPENHNFAFTTVCNNCGSINVGTWHVYRDGEMTGYAVRCRDCKQDIEY